MTNCDWCGDTHDPTDLCQRAQRAVTRRSFCFLFGAGIVGAIAARAIQWPFDPETMVEFCRTYVRACMTNGHNPACLTLPRPMYDRLMIELETLGQCGLPTPDINVAFEKLNVHGMRLGNIYPAKDDMIHSTDVKWPSPDDDRTPIVASKCVGTSTIPIRREFQSAAAANKWDEHASVEERWP